MKRGQPANPNRPLSVKQERFVAGLVAGRTQRAAAIEAGYTAGGANDLAANPRVQKALDETRAQVREHATYDAKAAFGELTTMIEEARGAKQFTAVANLLQTKLKLLGLLIERSAFTSVNLLGVSSQVADAESRLRLTSTEYLLPTEHVPAEAEPVDIFAGDAST